MTTSGGISTVISRLHGFDCSGELISGVVVSMVKGMPSENDVAEVGPGMQPAMSPLDAVRALYAASDLVRCNPKDAPGNCCEHRRNL